MSTWHLTSRILLLSIAVSVILPIAAEAEPCLLVYPLDTAIFRYDPADFEIKTSTDPQYDPTYGVSGYMLWDTQAQRVAVEAYRAPGLAGFEPSTDGRNEFYFTGNITTVCVDGFSEFPRQLNDIYVEFVPYPTYSAPDIYVDGERIEGLRYRIPRMVVATPIGDGYYSETNTFIVRWIGSQFVRILVYADKNGNRVFDGEPCVSVLMEDLTVPTESQTWGSIKALYQVE